MVNPSLIPNGSITSQQLAPTIWRVTDAIPYLPGPLPLTGAFTVTPPAGATILLRISPSGFSGVANMLRVITVLVDGSQVATLSFFFNQTIEQHAFVPRTFNLTGLPPGPHTVTLQAEPGLITDLNDRYQATVEQLPG